MSDWSYIFLQFNEKGTHIDEESNVPLLEISHPSSAHGIGVQSDIDTILSSLKSSMDVQTINGKKMPMKYVSSYVSKCKESIHTETLYTSTLSPATAAFCKKIAIPFTSELASDNSTIINYYNCTQDCEHLSLPFNGCDFSMNIKESLQNI